MLPHKRNLRKEGLKLLTVAWMRVCVCVFDFDFVRHWVSNPWGADPNDRYSWCVCVSGGSNSLQIITVVQPLSIKIPFPVGGSRLKWAVRGTVCTFYSVLVFGWWESFRWISESPLFFPLSTYTTPHLLLFSTPIQTIVELTQERDCVQLSPLAPCSTQSPGDSPSMRRTESRQHLSVELADAKAKIRRLRQELWVQPPYQLFQ